MIDNCHHIKYNKTSLSQKNWRPIQTYTISQSWDIFPGIEAVKTIDARTNNCAPSINIPGRQPRRERYSFELGTKRRGSSFNDPCDLMRGHACSSATVLSPRLFSFSPPARCRPPRLVSSWPSGVPGITSRDKGGLGDLITSSTIMHADTTHYAHPLARRRRRGRSVPSSPMLILRPLSTPLSLQKLTRG